MKQHPWLCALALVAVAAQRPGIQKVRPDQAESNRSQQQEEGVKGNARTTGPGLSEGKNMRPLDRQGPPPGVGVRPDVGEDAAAPPLERPVTPFAPDFAGTPRQGLAEVRRMCAAGDPGSAALLARKLVTESGELAEPLAAELCYAEGVARSLAEEDAAAAPAFRSAAALAGPSELRSDALYNEAVAYIDAAEVLRSQIMEIAVKEGRELSQEEEERLASGQDSLPQARDTYLEAKRRLVDRIRTDWRDVDTRANLEFVQRRLDELAEIAASREAAKNQRSQEGQDTEKTQQGTGSSKGEQQSEEEQEEEGKLGDSEESEEESVEESDPKPGEGADRGNDLPDPTAEEEADAEQQKQQEAEQGDEDDSNQSEEGGAKANDEMSRQEARMVLDTLNELEEKAKKLRAARAKLRYVPVARDW